MNPYSVRQAKAHQLLARMERLGIREEDLVERFVRSAGPGGQNVNKVSTCVWLKHPPTGLEVKVQRERSQVLNRFWARWLLADKVEARREVLFRTQQRRAAKLRRQRRRRSGQAKEKVLAEKRLRSLKKRFRARPSAED